MKRLIAAVAALALTVTPVLAKDRIVKLTLDGRPVDREGGIAIMHDGIVFADSIDLAKTFQAAVTFGGASERIQVNAHYGVFTVGRRTATIDGAHVTLPGAPFMREDDMYIPLEFFVKRIAGPARLRFVPGHADIRVNLNPL